MKTSFCFFSVLLSLFVISCRNGKQSVQPAETPSPESAVETELPSQPGDSLFLTYSRTPCFGMCPVFEMRVYGSGYAIYYGKNFVNRIGYYHTRFGKAALHNISDTAEDIGYFGMKDKYDEPRVTDLPSVVTSIRGEGGLKEVYNRYQAPAELRKLYAVLDTLIADAQWKPLEKVGVSWD